MIDWLNVVSARWLAVFSPMVVQHTLLLALGLPLLVWLSRRDGRFTRLGALLLSVKLLVPIITLPPSSMNLPLPQFTLSVVTEASSSQAASPPDSRLSWIAVVGLLYLAGLAFLITREIRGSLHLRGLQREARQIFREGASAATPAPIYCTRENHSPLVVGLFHPRILVPRTWFDWDEGQRAAVLAHERAHLEHRDHWINGLLLVVRTVYFFHPLVWLLDRRIRLQSEMMSDWKACQTTRQTPEVYVRGLLDVMETLAREPRLAPSRPGLSRGGRALKNRITHLFTEQEDLSMKRTFRRLVVGLLGAALIGALAFSFAPARPLAEVLSPPHQVAAEPATISAQQAASAPKSDDVVQPVVLVKPTPRYTKEAIEKKVSGIVKIEAVISRNGRVKSAKLLAGLGYGLDEVALSTIKNQWRFKPATRNGVPIAYTANVEVIFKLY